MTFLTKKNKFNYIKLENKKLDYNIIPNTPAQVPSHKQSRHYIDYGYRVYTIVPKYLKHLNSRRESQYAYFTITFHNFDEKYLPFCRIIPKLEAINPDKGWGLDYRYAVNWAVSNNFEELNPYNTGNYDYTTSNLTSTGFNYDLGFGDNTQGKKIRLYIESQVASNERVNLDDPEEYQYPLYISIDLAIKNFVHSRLSHGARI